MTKCKSTLVSLSLPFAFCLLTNHTALAQSTLATAPSTDIVTEKKVDPKFDFISNYAHHYDRGFQSYVPRAIVGVRPNIEAGVNVVYTDGFGVSQPIEIQPNVKWRFYRSQEKGMAASLGCILYVPITHRTSTNTFGLCYTVMSKKLNGNYSPRFTVGGYALINRHDGNGAKAGAIAGYEQPLSGKVSFVMDWLSGENRFGYVTPGFSFATTQRSTLYAGYSIGNYGRKNNAFFAFYGITF